jgi:hypothetical protein
MPFALVPRSVSSTSSGSGPSATVVDCFNAEPLSRRDDARNELVESFEARDSDELLGVTPGLRGDAWEVKYGPRELDVRRGRGDIGRLLGWGEASPEYWPAKRSSHMVLDWVETLPRFEVTSANDAEAYFGC